jgi:hypothetical protein
MPSSRHVAAKGYCDLLHRSLSTFAKEGTATMDHAERATFSDALYDSVMECLSFFGRMEFKDQDEQSRRSTQAARLSTWVLDDPRVMDFFPDGLPSGPVHREVRGSVEAQVIDLGDVGTRAAQYPDLHPERFQIRLWHAGTSESGNWQRRDSLGAAAVGDAVAALKSCRRWIRERQRTPPRTAKLH